MKKSDIRLLVQKEIEGLTLEERQNESKEVCKKLIEVLASRDCENLITYEAFFDEVDVSEITRWCREKGKTVVTIPQSLDEFTSPTNGIIIVPGRAFTKDGKRVGRGSGFYDKILEKNPALISIGVCFDCQIFPDVPEDIWDKRVELVVFASNEIE